MTGASEMSGAAQGRNWMGLLRYWLTDRRVLILLAVAVLAGGAALNWGWLVAIGVAPILLAVAPCGLMCLLGLCSMGGRKRTPSIGPNPSGGGDGPVPISQVMSGESTVRRE